MSQPPHILDDGTEYPRNLRGYGATPPDPRWPGGASLALSFVLNYEEGGENTVLNGDAASEVYLHEVPGGTPLKGERNRSVESQFDYGARAGVWRVLRLFAGAGFPLTVYGVGRALELNPTPPAPSPRPGTRSRRTPSAGSTTTRCPRPTRPPTSRAASRPSRA
jgi:hypothetical protein